MTGQLGLLPPTANELRAEEADTAERSDDPTPRGIPRAVLAAAVRPEVNPHLYAKFCAAKMFAHAPEIPHVNAVRVLDVCAGHGAWASEMRRLAQLQGWPVHITGVELHAPREPDLRKWCDVATVMDWREYMAAVAVASTIASAGPGFDLVLGNPHFPALTGDGDGPSMPETLLEHAPAVLLLHTQQAFLKSEAGRAAWRRCPPAASWLVPGSVKFRSGVNPKCPKCGHSNTGDLDRCDGPGPRSMVTLTDLETQPIRDFDTHDGICGGKLKKWGADSRCYQVSLWLRGHDGPTSTHLLPELTAAERQWVVPPGSEQPSADLPAAPGWTP